jgi:hypothetical protein
MLAALLIICWITIPIYLLWLYRWHPPRLVGFGMLLAALLLRMWFFFPGFFSVIALGATLVWALIDVSRARRLKPPQL